MGRPKGSLNKKYKKVTPVIPVIKRKRGRPKKIVEPVIEAIVPPSDMKKTKFLGYCPKCDFMIVKRDLISKFLFICPSCNKRARIKQLKKELKRSEPRPATKKEYLENTIDAKHIEMLALNDREIDPKDLKVQDI